jgi:hypothetical protein
MALEEMPEMAVMEKVEGRLEISDDRIVVVTTDGSGTSSKSTLWSRAPSFFLAIRSWS